MEYIIGQNFYKSLPRNEKEKILNKIKSFCEELVRTEGIIREISSGFWVRKIKNTNIFKFRLNSGDRFLFSYENLLFENKETSRIVFLEFVEHDKQVRVANRISNIEIDFLEYSVDDVEENYDKKVVEDYYDIGNFIGYEIKSDAYLKELIDTNNSDYLYYLNKEQYQCLIKKPPVLISGSAGSGKTTIGIRKILNIEEFKNDYQKIGYFTFNNFLKEETLKVYNKYRIEENRSVHFYTVNEFCSKQLKKEESLFCGYRKFSKWYKKERINSSKVLKNIDVSSIWAEIRGIIKGSMLEDWIRSLDLSLNIIDFSFYKELSDKYSDFNEEERKELYNLTVEYNSWLKNNNLYDDNDLAFEILTNIQKSEFDKFDFIVCDEVQDLTELQIYMLKELTKNGKEIYFSGDIHQIINPNYFSFGRLRNMFYSLDNILKTPVEILSKNYRSQEKIVTLANKLSEIRKEKIGSFGSDDYIEYSIRDGKTPILMEYSKDTLEKALKMSETNAKFVVIVPDDETAMELKGLNKNAMVRTVTDIKGLEYKYIVTVNIVTNNLKFLNGENRNSARHHFNYFYVAITRAIDELYIIEENQENFLIKEIEGFVEKTQDFPTDVEEIKSTRSEWSEEAKRLEGMELFLDAALAYKKAFEYEEEKRCIKKYYFETNDYEKAGDYFYNSDKQEALKCYERIENKSFEIQVKIFELQEDNEKLGDLFSNIDREKSIDYYNKGFNKTKDNLELKIKILLLDNKYEEVGDLYLKANKEEIAKKYFLKVSKKDILIEAKILECDSKYEEAGDLLIEENKRKANIYYKKSERSVKSSISKERIKNKILFCNGKEIKTLEYFIENENDRFIDLCTQSLSLKKMANSDEMFIHKYFIKLFEKRNTKGVSALLKISKNQFLFSTALFWASQEGDTDILVEAINTGVDINVKDSEGRTALIIAAAIGNEKIVEELLRRKAHLDIQDNTRNTALIWSLQEGNIEIAKRLINAGADLNIQNRNRDTVLMLAVKKGYLEIIKDLIAKGVNLNKINIDGNTALIIASQDGNIEVAKHLIESGAKIDIKDNDGMTALMWAAIDGHVEIVKKLVAKGANLDKQDNDGNTALIIAAQEEHIEVAKHLIESGANLDIKDNNKDTALIRAVIRGHIEIVKSIVEAGPSLNIQDEKGKTAIHLAIEKGCTDIEKNLMLAGDDFLDKEGYKEYLVKTQKNYIEILKYLINVGAKLNIKDINGNTALMLLTEKGYEDIVKEAKLL